MDKAQIEHAQRVCRQLVVLGYADKETARSHFKDYLLYLNLGFEGNFSQILHARKIIDDRGLREINASVPPLSGGGPLPAAIAGMPPPLPGKPVGMTSMVLKLPAQEEPTHLPSDRHPIMSGSGFGPTGQQPMTPSQRAEATLQTPELDGAAGMTLVEAHFELPASGPSRSMLEGSVEDLLAFEAPRKQPNRGSPRPGTLEDSGEHDAREGGTVEIPESAISGGRRSKGLAASTEGFADVLAPNLKTQGFNEVRLRNPARRPATNHPTQDYDSLKGHQDWGVKSTPSFDSGSQAPDDTGDQFWHNESGEEEDSPFLEPKVGGYMGEFELLEVLGQGGMGIVFKVRHQGTDDLYALKVLRVRKGAKTETRRKRFRTEVQAMQRLKHKNIVGVHGYGRDGPFDWYVMDYVEGKDFSTLLKAQALSVDQRLDIFSQITQAIVHAHKRGVIHRDLKPQNILVTTEVQVFILDFGLAKLLDDDEGMTHTGSALGTPFYMSPEQIADPRAVGAQADVFALGVMLYEIMTGVRPFTGHSAGEVGNKILTVDPPKPSKIEPSVHANIDAICMNALEKSLERRYPTSEHLLSDIELHRKGKSLRQESRFAGVRRWVERNRSGFMGGIAVSLMVIALMLVVAFMLWLMID